MCNGTRPPYRRLNSTRTPSRQRGREGKRGTSKWEFNRAQKSLATPTFAPRAIDLVTRAETCHVLGDISPATLYRGIASGRYPAPLKIGPTLLDGIARSWKPVSSNSKRRCVMTAAHESAQCAVRCNAGGHPTFRDSPQRSREWSVRSGV